MLLGKPLYRVPDERWLGMDKILVYDWPLQAFWRDHGDTLDWLIAPSTLCARPWFFWLYLIFFLLFTVFSINVLFSFKNTSRCQNVQILTVKRRKNRKRERERWQDSVAGKEEDVKTKNQFFFLLGVLAVRPTVSFFLWLLVQVKHLL